jgi:hypothetical protein
MTPGGQGSLGLGRRQWREAAIITLVAAVAFVVIRKLPTGTNLSHMDFRVEGSNVIEFCDPANPQFLPVVAVRSPVSLAVTTASPAQAGTDVDAMLVLTTFSGKPIAPEDLQVVQTRPIHLLIADPSLDDYQHVHPVPGRRAGEWAFRFHPRFGGTYRIFADFTPVATNRGLYSEAEMNVEGPANPVVAGTQPLFWTADVDGYRFTLAPASLPVRAAVQANLTLSVRHIGGGPVQLEPVMGAFAHLVAFDTQRSGFAHIHPNPAEAAIKPDPTNPVFTFRLMIPRSGRYVIWSQVNLAGRETFAPFWFAVEN